MATEFVVTVRSSGGDFTSLSQANTTLACNLGSLTTRVYSVLGTVGKSPSGTLTGSESGKTATLVYANVAQTQFLVVSSTGDFTSGENALDNQGNGFVAGTADSPIVRIDCYPFQDTTVVILSGWGTSATNYLRIRVPPGSRHGGSRLSSAYNLTVNGSNTPALDVEVGAEYTRLEGLQVRNSGSTNPVGIQVNCSDTSDVRISDCIVYDITGSSSPGFSCLNGLATFMNCAAMNVGKGFSTASASGTTFATNCTAMNCGSVGFSAASGSTFNVKNCYAGASATADYDTIGGATWSLTACYSVDGTHSTATAACSTSSGARFINVTSGSENPLLQSASSLRNVGAAQPSWTHPLGLVGIRGNLRRFKWDVGCDEYPIPAPTPGRPDEPDPPAGQQN